MSNVNNISFKEDRFMLELWLVHPLLFYAFLDVSNWANEKGLPVKVTNVCNKVPKESKTDSHPSGRAVDLSVVHWPDRFIRMASYMFNTKYEDIAAISNSDGKPRFFVYHKTENGEWHIHLQINAKYSRVIEWPKK